MQTLFTKNFKIFLVLILSFIVVGMIFLGVFGFNKTVDAGEGYEVTVHVNQYTPTGNTIEVTQNAAKEYFADKGITPLVYEQREEGMGLTFIYKFREDVTNECKDMQPDIQAVLDEKAEIKGLTVKTEINKVTAFFDFEFGWILLALGIATILIFIYLMFLEKFVSALSVIASSILAVILYVSLISITRIPINSTGATVGVFTFVLAMILSVVMVNRFKETQKLHSEYSMEDMAKKVSASSLKRFLFTGISVLAVALLLIIFGSVYVKFLGLQILIADVVAWFSVFYMTPVVYVLLKKLRKS